MGENEFAISSIVDRPGIESDISFLIDQIKIATDAIKSIKAPRLPVAQGNGDAASFAKAMKEMTAAAEKSDQTIADLTGRLAAMEAAMKASAAASNQNTQATKTYTAENAKAAQSNQALVSGAKSASNAILGGADSYAYFANSVEEVIRQQLNLNRELESVKEQIKENDKAFKSGKLSVDDYKDKKIELVKTQKELKLQTAALTKEINIQLKAEEGSSGSIEQLTNQYNALYVIFKKLTDAERNSESGQQLINSLGQLKSNINEIQKQAGNFSANVGRYAESLNPALSLLNEELFSIRQQLSGMKEGDAAFAKLAEQERSLAAITNTLNETLKKTGNLTPLKEMRALTNAAKELGTQFGLSSEIFEKFSTEVGERKDELGDIQNAINFKASDTRYLDGIVSAVNGVVGVYGAAQAASALWGDENEDLQKSMQKLQAILALVTSLQAIQNSVQTDGAAVQTILAAKTALLSAAKETLAFFSGTATTATHAEAVANTELAVAAGASAVALEGVAVANTEAAVTAGAAAVAVEGEAVAATAATAATTGLTTALVASGIGALIIAIVAAIAYLVTKVNDWANADKEAIKRQNELVEATQRLNKAISDQAQFIRQRNQAAVDFAQRELTLSKARGENTAKQFALEKTLAEAQQKQADAVVAKLGATEEGVNRATHAYADALTQVKYYTELERKATAEGKEDWVEYYKIRRESAEKLESSEKENLDTISNALKEQADIANHLQELQTQEAAYNAAERRRINLEYLKANAELQIDANARLLADEKSTQAEKIKSLRSTAEEQRRIANAEANAVINNPGSSAADKIIAAKQQSAAVIKINRDEQEQIIAINNEYETRRINARIAANRSIIEENNSLQQSLIDAEELSVDQRTKAAERLFENKKELLDAEYAEQIRQAKLTGKTQEELYALEVDYSTKLLQLTTETHKNITAVITSELKKQQDAQEEYYKYLETLKDTYDLDAISQYAEEVIALNDSLQRKKISYTEYLKQRNSLDAAYGEQQLNNQIKTLKKSLSYLEEILAGKEDAEADYLAAIKLLEEQADATDNQREQQRLAAKIKQLKEDLKAYQDNIEKKKELLAELKKAEKEQSDAAAANAKKSREDNLNDIAAQIQAYGTLVQSSLGVFSEIANIGFDKQQAAIEELNAAQEKAYEKEVKRISALNISDAQRADMLTALEVRRAAEKQETDRKLRKIEIERARFEKAANIANIITSTALAVVNALKTSGPLGIALAAAVGALGAAQLARAIATPLPKFAEGTDNAPEGWAITGEKGVERVTEPSGKTWYTPPTASLTYLKKGSKVTPHHDLIYEGFDRMVAATINPNKPVTEESFARAYVSAIENKMDSLIAAVNNKPVPTVTNTWAGLQLSITQGKNIIERKNWYNS